MKRFLIFKSGYGGNDNEASELYIGDFDVVEDILSDIPKLRKELHVIDELSVQILDTSDGAWHTFRLYPLEENHLNGRHAEQYQRNLAALTALSISHQRG